MQLMGFQSRQYLLNAAARHHIFLSPSVVAEDGDCEGGAPLAIAEMAAVGMIVVSTKHCDIPSMIQMQEGGFLANERDPQGLATHLRWLVANPDRWASIRQAARQRIESFFNAEVQGRTLSDIYIELAQR